MPGSFGSARVAEPTFEVPRSRTNDGRATASPFELLCSTVAISEKAV